MSPAGDRRADGPGAGGHVSGDGFEFGGELWEWRGPAPYYFVSVPDQESEDIRADADLVTYGWGMIPVTVEIGSHTFTTSLWPKDGRYIVPIRKAVRLAEELEDGDVVTIRMRLRAD